ncbi:MAG TPA: hypothetical protein PKU97_20065 [Kofleriaceae bacterium]|nr:hypothetical protein [Kofleriaceae bacterium]
MNDRGDRYCGGCGSLLESSRPPHDDRALEAGPAVPAAHAAGPAAAAGLAGLAGLTAASTATPELGELAELLRPLVPAPRDGHLPSSGITQDDLDRLFGGPP